MQCIRGAHAGQEHNKLVNANHVMMKTIDSYLGSPCWSRHRSDHTSALESRMSLHGTLRHIPPVELSTKELVVQRASGFHK